MVQVYRCCKRLWSYLFTFQVFLEQSSELEKFYPISAHRIEGTANSLQDIYHSCWHFDFSESKQVSFELDSNNVLCVTGTGVLHLALLVILLTWLLKYWVKSPGFNKYHTNYFLNKVWTPQNMKLLHLELWNSGQFQCCSFYLCQHFLPIIFTNHIDELPN